MGKEKVIPILAIIIIAISVSSTVYVYATHIDKDTISLNGNEYTIDEIFALAEERTIDTTEGEKTGAALDDLILKAGVSCPACHEYTITAKDSYQQTVEWSIFQTGILSDPGRVFFPDTPKKFWVSDIVEIEVI
jgi:hypothetical protein